MTHLRARAISAPWWGGIEVLLYQSYNGSTYADVVTDFIITTDMSPTKAIEPSFVLDREDAQRLIDDLWECGLRPSSGAGSAGQLAATQAHLEDMRRLAFEKGGKA